MKKKSQLEGEIWMTVNIVEDNVGMLMWLSSHFIDVIKGHLMHQQNFSIRSTDLHLHFTGELKILFLFRNRLGLRKNNIIIFQLATIVTFTTGSRKPKFLHHVSHDTAQTCVENCQPTLPEGKREIAPSPSNNTKGPYRSHVSCFCRAKLFENLSLATGHSAQIVMMMNLKRLKTLCRNNILAHPPKFRRSTWKLKESRRDHKRKGTCLDWIKMIHISDVVATRHSKLLIFSTKLSILRFSHNDLSQVLSYLTQFITSELIHWSLFHDQSPYSCVQVHTVKSSRCQSSTGVLFFVETKLKQG